MKISDFDDWEGSIPIRICKICNKGQPIICRDCYNEKDRQTADLLTTIRQLKACMRLAKSEIDLAVLSNQRFDCADKSEDLSRQSNSKEFAKEAVGEIDLALTGGNDERD